MNITLYREIKGHDFIKEMENKHKSIENLEKKIKEENNALYISDLENWKIFIKNPNETLKEIITKFVEQIHTVTIDFELLQIIKKEKPSSISELVQLTNDNIYDINQKINYLEANGFIEVNNNKPIVNYDKIEIAI